MVSKLIFLLMDWETFTQLPVLQQFRGVIRALNTAQKMKFSIKYFSSKCEHLLEMSSMENFIFCKVSNIHDDAFGKSS